MPCKHRKHTPIVSEKQRGFFGAEYARKKKGLKGKTDMSKAELRRHLKESKGKNLPASTASKRRKKRRRNRSKGWIKKALKNR